MSDESSADSTALINWQEIVDWARGVGDSLAYWDDVTAEAGNEEERERDYRDALATA